jgi:acetylornithine deacetylase/succinyl-diaminopimelate desuccinylase-like protein
MDTTNPPGNERICADYLAAQLAEVGYRPELLELAPGRTNLIVRHRGTGARPTLLLTAHLDVVEADASQWRRPPEQPALIQPLVRLVARPHLLARLVPSMSIARTFSALLSNTASATVVRAGNKTNVIPAEVLDAVVREICA